MNYKCSKCPFSSSRKDFLECHIKLHSSKNKVFKCNQCDYIAAKRHQLKLHVERIHQKISTTVKEENGRKIITTIIDTIPKPIKIKEVKIFPARQVNGNKKLKEHLDLRKKPKTARIENGIYYCFICDYKTRTRACYYKHVKRHDQTKRFSCEFCEFKTHCKYNLRYHRRKHFAREFKCHLCEKEYTRKIDLKYHLESIHGVVEKPKLSFEKVLDFSGADFLDYLT